MFLVKKNLLKIIQLTITLKILSNFRYLTKYHRSTKNLKIMILFSKTMTTRSYSITQKFQKHLINKIYFQTKSPISNQERQILPVSLNNLTPKKLQKL
jgi:hypothetical protein